jgi:carboxypeptidase Taq
MDAYKELIKELREIAVLGSVEALLGWDEHVNLPTHGAEHRGDQNALIARLKHERFTSPHIGELLAKVEASDPVRDPESDAAANVRNARRDYDRATKIPADLVEEMAKTAVLSQHAWVEARKTSKFKTFEPWLAKTVDLKKREAKCVGWKDHIYDALLDPYEPGETTANLRRVFDSLRDPLIELIGKISTSGKRAPVEVLQGNFAIHLQERFGRIGAEAIGFDFKAGRLDTTVHPFCSGIAGGDTRITTRYNTKTFVESFMGVLHETGHALYEQGLPKAEHFGEPIAEAISLGIHESQSRLWENLVGRRKSFWRYFRTKAHEVFGPALREVDENTWNFAINDIRPSFIRVESDEATYNLHILLRFELEQALVTDEIRAADLPAAWNERMQKYLGITPPDDARGCLQDIHWSMGSIGYFATYTLGNLYSAQFYERAAKDLGDLDAMFARGEFAPLLKWLREKIHRHGRRYTAGDLVKRVTGKPLSAEPLLNHLRSKARELYGV